MGRILVIDDEESIRSLLQTILQRRHHDVLLAASGAEGLEQFRQHAPDVTILDLKMPGMNGLQVLQHTRAVAPMAPVIVLTGAGTEATEQEARAYGITAFLTKQFSLHELGAALRLVLGNSA
ncbi:response regulator [Nitrospira moscoviensis]|uniref:response regulator n=1 Tax=Nitrospira moscoviensis TaxID=42253 RepID=UPI0006A75B06|nr:response regulator [Nitrospira moscoviensis]